MMGEEAHLKGKAFKEKGVAKKKKKKIHKRGDEHGLNWIRALGSLKD